MNKITFPSKSRMKRQTVADLQDGLRLLLDKGLVRLSDAERQAVEERLRTERTKNHYGLATRKLVELCQEQHHLRPNGAVDESTAKVLNAVLEELGAFSPAAPDQHRLVGGQVRREDGQPFPGAMVRAFHTNDRGTLRLGEDATDAEGRYTIRYAKLPGLGLAAEGDPVGLTGRRSASAGAVRGPIHTVPG